MYLDSTQIHDYQDNSIGMVVRPGISGLESPEMRLPSFTRPNVDGAVVPNQLYGGRIITLTGTVFSDNSQVYRDLRRDLNRATAIRRDIDGTLLPRILKFTTDDDLTLQIEVYTKKLQFEDVNMTHGMYKLDLFAPVHQLVSQQQKSATIFVFEGGGFTIPFEIPFAMDVFGDVVTELENEGNVEAYPVYTLVGPLEDPTFTNLTTGEQFSLDYTLSTSSDSIVIDTLKRTVIYKDSPTATGTNILSSFTGDFVTLVDGINQVKLTNTSSSAGYLSVVYRDSYSGI